MLPIHIMGHAGCGKTTLIVALIEALVKKNIKVGTLKHSAHVHELDKPGKDSYQHRMAGAKPVAMVTEQLSAIYLPREPETSPENLLKTYFKNVDIVLIEGWISGPYTKIELWREEVGRPPLYSKIQGVKAIVTDDEVDSEGLPVFKRFNLDDLIDFIIDLKK
jgi:molybdopterin-guanine dinucleotide biosynthesis adapter protein